ncbi:hypothetical protein ACWEJ6_49060 [Nonomuraea sp. NPDC004702]
MAILVSPAQMAAWLGGLMGDGWGSVRELSAAIRNGNGGQGPSHQTLMNLLDSTRTTKVDEHTIAAIAAFFHQDPADVERSLGITLSPSNKVVLHVSRIEGLRDLAIMAAQLPSCRLQEIHEMVRRAVANEATSTEATTQTSQPPASAIERDSA